MFKKSLLLISLSVVMLWGCTDIDSCISLTINVNKNIELTQIGDTDSFEVTCLTSWKMSGTIPSWMTLNWFGFTDSNPAGSEGVTPVTVTIVEPNFTGVPREVTFTFTAANGAKATVTVTQNEIAVIEISTAAQLADLADQVNAGENKAGIFYQLIANIDLSNYGTLWNGGKGWIPIGNNNTTRFSGYFDGNNHTISNLFINDNTTNFNGLFGLVSGGTIKNLGVENVDLFCFSYSGSVAGFVEGGNISNCYSTGKVSSTSSYVGGLIGVISDGNINNCYSTATVSGLNMIGGVTGSVGDGANMTNCYSTGAVSGGDSVGGVTGGVVGSVTNCVALNPSIERTNIGSNLGRVAGWSVGTLNENIAYDGMTAIGFAFGGDSGLNGVDIGIEDAVALSTYKGNGWGFGSSDSSPWKMGVGAYELPVFWWQTTAPASTPAHLASILISTPDQLEALSVQVNGGDNKAGLRYKLINNINVGSAWIPIGNYSSGNATTCFAGTFNGNGFTVTIDGMGAVTPEFWGTYDVGLFGSLGAGALVQNLTVAGSLSYTIAEDYCNLGGIVGSNYGGTIRNCVAAANIVLTATGNSSFAGGIVGIHYTGVIDNCYSVANVLAVNTTGNSTAGGIAGANIATIANCYAVGKIESIGLAGGRDVRVGGVVGSNSGNTANCVALNAGVAIGSGNAGNPFIGRVTGYNSVTLENNRAIEISGINTTGILDNHLDGLLISQTAAETPSTYQIAAPLGAGWSFGTTATAPWVWSATLKRPILYWE
ncbi:MAG: hypothetical protein LBC84_04105 [Prevotellaceae bacterium]|jgi:hypothetical protein|nr:hypothetical protein [Prevotellaceae bacterium]